MKRRWKRKVKNDAELIIVNTGKGLISDKRP
jgi:ribosomal protein S8